MPTNVYFEWSTLDTAIEYFDSIAANAKTSKDIKKYNQDLYFFINSQYDEIKKLKKYNYNVSVKKINYNKYQILIINEEHLEKTQLTNFQIFKLQEYSNYLLKNNKNNNLLFFKNKYLICYLIILLLVIFLY